ncbi:MAG: PIN domain-containing protein [Acidobacteria bacterium]|nr:PIN domain-containing protein [Acidobacteriota bacterium]
MVIADSGFWLALSNAKDLHHSRALAWLDVLQEALITTWPVVTETCHLLVRRTGLESQHRFLESYREGAFKTFALEHRHASRITTLMRKYSDLPMDLADASLVILAEHLGHGRILSTDRRDFHAYRWKERRPFHNLLVEEPPPAGQPYFARR